VVRPRKARITLPPHINAVRARGKDYYYFHPARGTDRGGKAIRIGGEPVNADGSLNIAWWESYRALAGETPASPHHGTFAALIEAYQQSPEWEEPKPRTRVEWTRHLNHVHTAWGKRWSRGCNPSMSWLCGMRRRRNQQTPTT
jgi:hypothetical protein